MGTVTGLGADALADPVVGRIRRDLERLYGHRLDRLVLFGSRARGEARADSDYDIAVFLKDYDGAMTEVDRLADLSWDLQVATGAVISMLPLPAHRAREKSLLLQAIREDGVAL